MQALLSVGAAIAFSSMATAQATRTRHAFQQIRQAPAPTQSVTNCDGAGVMFCGSGYCYAGDDGFLGCCTVSSCAARTTCIPYTASGVSECNADTGGCTGCTNLASPSCVTITNEAMNQHIMYCAPSGGDITSSYQGVSQDLSTASPPMTSTTSSASSTSATSSNSSSTTANTSSNTSSQTSSATAASAQQPQPTSTSHSSVSGGEIAGIVIGCLAALGLAIFLILFAIRRRRRSNAAHQANKSGPSSSPSTSEKPPLQYTQGPFEAPGHAADFTGLAAPNATPRANDDRTSIMTTWPHATQMTNTMPTHSSKAVNMLGVSEKDGTAISATAPKNPANNTISPQSNQTTWPSPPSGYDASSSGRPSPPSNTNSNILTSGPFQNTPPQGCIPSWSELPPSQSQRTSMNNHPPTSVRGQNTPSTSMYAPYRTSAELQPPTPRFENLRGGHTSQTSADGGLFGAAFGNTAGHASYLSAEDALAHGYSEGGQATGKEQTRGHGASTNF